jgi:uncharacterized protein YjdB
VKKTYLLTIEISPDTVDAKNAVVKWKSSDSGIATVTAGGKVTTKKGGTVTITATTADGVSAKVKLKVSTKAVSITQVKLSASSNKMIVGQTLAVTAAVKPSTADTRSLVWSSSNTKVATVNSRGEVKAKKKGTVTITAQDKQSGKKGTIKLAISNLQKPVIKAAKSSKTRTATLTWKKISQADGYEIAMASSKTGKYKNIKTITKAGTVTLTKTGLIKGKTYYFKVRAYVKSGSKKVYSDYSAVKPVTVK